MTVEFLPHILFRDFTNNPLQELNKKHNGDYLRLRLLLQLQFSTPLTFKSQLMFDLTGKGEMSQTLLTNKKQAHIIKPT
jgi:hypothetical protein